MTDAPPRVLHVITGLETGGAEMMLWKVLGGLTALGWPATVISLRDRGALAGRIEALGAGVQCLGLGGGTSLPSAVRALRAAVRAHRPDVLQGWMYHGNLAALLARSAAATRTPVVWNVRQSLAGLRHEKRLTAAVIRLGAWLSSRPDRILYNSRAGAAQHEAFGFAPARTQVIPNGFDTDRFRPAAGARAALARRVGAPESAPLVGVVARYHPVKNHLGFLDAAARLDAARRDARFILAGAGVDDRNQDLADAIRNRGLTGRVHLLGEADDVPALMAGLDVLCSPSDAEGFPNVLGEAMASGTPCVATDVGDAAWIVGDTGFIVPAGDPAALAAALGRMLATPPDVRVALGAAARARIVRDFSLPSVVAQYADLYRTLAGRRGAPIMEPA